MSDPIITYVEFDDNQAKGQPAKTLSYAEWEPLNDDDSGSGYGNPRDDQEPIPDEVRVALAKIVLGPGHRIAKVEKYAALVAALSDLRKRFHAALIIGTGTDPEFADAAVAGADAALAQVEA